LNGNFLVFFFSGKFGGRRRRVPLPDSGKAEKRETGKVYSFSRFIGWAVFFFSKKNVVLVFETKKKGEPSRPSPFKALMKKTFPAFTAAGGVLHGYCRTMV
jgi:hypothetical protein